MQQRQMTAARRGAGGGGAAMPTSPNFTQSELNMLLTALGGAGDTPTSGVSGGINPFGRADASAALSPTPRSAKKGKK